MVLITVEKLVGMVGPQGLTTDTIGELRLRVGQVVKMEKNIGDLAMLAMVDGDYFWRVGNDNGRVDWVEFDREERRVIFGDSSGKNVVNFLGLLTDRRSEVHFEGVLTRPEIIRWDVLNNLGVAGSFDFRNETVYFGEEPFKEITKQNEVIDRVLGSVPAYKEMVIRGRRSVVAWDK